MRIVSVNVGMPAELATYEGVVMSGIVKRPVAGPVRVGRTNLEGDGQADLRVHGGAEMAVYMYPHAHYAAWRAELGRDDLTPGFFGENLTVEGLAEDDVRFGDRLRAGTAVLEVGSPRQPCYKLAARTGEPAFARRFLRSGRIGWYLRVVEEGVVEAGDALEVASAAVGSMTVGEICRLIVDGSDPAELERAAGLEGLAPGYREWFAERADAVRRRPMRRP